MLRDTLKTELKANLNNLEDESIEEWVRIGGWRGTKKKLFTKEILTLEGKISDSIMSFLSSPTLCSGLDLLWHELDMNLNVHMSVI